MTNVFQAGSDLVRWEIIAFGADGPFRLTIDHPTGSIVEYFPTTAAALDREAELERLLIAARGAGSKPAGSVR
jgi:hypothetical protein